MKTFLKLGPDPLFDTLAEPRLGLGHWCKETAFLDSDLHTVEHKLQKYTEFLDSYRQGLKILSSCLSQIHQKNFSQRFYTIILGTWWMHFCFLVKDRQNRLNRACKDQVLYTKALDPDSWTVPENSIDFVQNIYADHYQMQICSQLLEDFPIEVEWILHQKPESDALINRHKPSLLKPLAGLYQKFLQYISPREAILYGSYFTQKEEQLLSLYSLGKIAKLPNLTLPELKLTPSNRSTLQSLLEKEGMEPFLARLTSLNLPLLWLEGFPQALAWVNREFPPAPRRIFSSGGIHEHDGFKIWTALASEKGSLLYLAQHGGNYGVLHQIPYHIIEKDCADRFLSWGWQEDRVLPFPSIKLSRIHAPEHNHSGRILFAASSHCRYPIDPYYFQDGLEEYKQNQSAFVATLEAELRERLLCRFHWSDSGWNLRHNLENKFPDLMFDTMDIPFLKSLFQSSLYVCDLLSTTYLEAFVANHPTILFLQKIECPVAQSAKPLIQSLYEQKIIHFDPVSAAQTINIMGQNPLEWWMQKDRQKAVQNFTSVYAKTTPDYLKQYRQLLLKGEI